MPTIKELLEQQKLIAEKQGEPQPETLTLKRKHKSKPTNPKVQKDGETPVRKF